MVHDGKVTNVSLSQGPRSFGKLSDGKILFPRKKNKTTEWDDSGILPGLLGG